MAPAHSHSWMVCTPNPCLTQQCNQHQHSRSPYRLVPCGWGALCQCNLRICQRPCVCSPVMLLVGVTDIGHHIALLPRQGRGALGEPGVLGGVWSRVAQPEHQRAQAMRCVHGLEGCGLAHRRLGLAWMQWGSVVCVTAPLAQESVPCVASYQQLSQVLSTCTTLYHLNVACHCYIACSSKQFATALTDSATCRKRLYHLRKHMKIQQLVLNFNRYRPWG